MGQSLAQIYVHLTFGTKHRFQLIGDICRPELHSYIAGILDNYDSPALIINSVPDHIHILFRLSKNYALADIIEEIKKESSKWMKKTVGGDKHFYWQNGYGAFSIGSNSLARVRRYIERQNEHHKKQDYRAEIEEHVKNYDIIEYNPDYFWR